VEDTVSDRLNQTYHTIYDPLMSARETAQNLINNYRKEYNRGYNRTLKAIRRRVLEFITPMIEWIKSAEELAAKQNKTIPPKDHTVKLIHNTLERNLGNKDKTTESSAAPKTAAAKSGKPVPKKAGKPVATAADDGDDDGGDD